MNCNRPNYIVVFFFRGKIVLHFFYVLDRGVTHEYVYEPAGLHNKVVN